MKLTTKQDAKASGERFYFTGKPCSKGHIAKRTTASSNCCQCLEDNRAHNRAMTKKWVDGKKSDPEYMAKKRLEDAERSKAYHKENRAECLRKMKGRNKSYYQKNKQSIIDSVTAYANSNRESVRAYKRVWQKERLKSDISYKVAAISRRMLHRVLGVAGQGKQKSTTETIGYSCECLIKRLESTFTSGMSWDNYGEWHIDHIKPIKEFTKNNCYDPKQINALNNLQALWAKDNLSKGASYE